jgi:hypothetical protein
MIPGLVAHTCQVKKSSNLVVHSSQVNLFFQWALGIEVCTSCPSAQFHCQREELIEEETKMREGGSKESFEVQTNHRCHL